MKTKTLSLITYSLIGLTLISCVLSITNDDIYQDGEWIHAQWLGQDIVTLLIALPFLMVSYFKGIKNVNTKWKMVYCGILLYYAYSYTFLVYGAKLTVLYLFHFPMYGLSIIGLVISFIHLFNQKINFTFENNRLKNGIIFYLVIMALMISFLWLNDIISHLVNPEHTFDTPNGEPLLIVYSLDLGIIIPLMIASAVLMFRSRNSGYLLSGILLVKTSTLGFALMAMSISLYLQKQSLDYFLVILWFIIGMLSTVLTILYLRKLRLHASA